METICMLIFLILWILLCVFFFAYLSERGETKNLKEYINTLIRMEENTQKELKDTQEALSRSRSNYKALETQKSQDLSKVTRLEVISDQRELVKYGVAVEMQLQDNGRTMKIFYKARK